MKILFNEQDLINSVCVFTSERYNEDINNLQADIQYEIDKGIFATINVRGERKNYDLTEQDVIDSVAIYLDQYHNFDPNQLSVELLFEEEKGVTAEIEKAE